MRSPLATTLHATAIGFFLGTAITAGAALVDIHQRDVRYSHGLDAVVQTADDDHTADLARINALEGELATARRAADDAGQRARAAEASRERMRASRSRRLPTPVVHTVDNSCGSNWLSSLGADERWIYERESGLDPTSADVNPSSGARGLGQLLDSTYADLGLTPNWNPCDEIAAARAYMRGRYGSWSSARAFWESHSWW